MRSVLLDFSDLDIEDRIDLADLDTLHALYNRLDNTEAIAISYAQSQSSSWDQRITDLVLRIWDDSEKVSFMKRGAKNLENTKEKAKAFTDFILTEVKQCWPDEETHTVISRMVRYFQNKIMYSLFASEPETFCKLLRKLNSEFVSKSKKLFLHLPQLNKVTCPARSLTKNGSVKDINGEEGADWFSGPAAAISRTGLLTKTLQSKVKWRRK